MERKMFGYRIKKPATGRTPGEPYNDDGEDNDSSYAYVKGKDFPPNRNDQSFGRSKDAPAGYEGKEHMKYKDPGYTSHQTRFPEDEPHMKSHAGKEEMHEMEDNYHMDVPDQTHYTLENKIKRARMKMDDPHQEDPDPLQGNLVRNVGSKGVEDTSGDEEMGPNDMQSGMSKDHRKKMIVAVAKRRMKKGK